MGNFFSMVSHIYSFNSIHCSSNGYGASDTLSLLLTPPMLFLQASEKALRLVALTPIPKRANLSHRWSAASSPSSGFPSACSTSPPSASQHHTPQPAAPPRRNLTP